MGLMPEDQLAEMVKLAPFSKVAGVGFHLLTPFHWGMEWVGLSLSANHANGMMRFAGK